MNLKKIILVLAVILVAAISMGQPRGGFGGRGMMGNNPAFMLNREDVQTDLALTDDQKTKLTEIRDGMRDQFTEVRTNANGDADAMRKGMAELMVKITDQINKILTADQQKRLKQIGMQLSGYSILATDKELPTTLGLTDDQKAKIKDLNDQMQAANQSIMTKIRNQEMTFQDAGPSFKKNSDALNDNIAKVLTADQVAKFKDLQGKVFVQAPPPGGLR